MEKGLLNGCVLLNANHFLSQLATISKINTNFITNFDKTVSDKHQFSMIYFILSLKQSLISIQSVTKISSLLSTRNVTGHHSL